MSEAYKKAGVDIDAGERLVDAISPLAKATARAGADAMLGGFGGVFDLKAAGYSDPLLVSGTDGVGTKLKIAFETGKHDTIGIDLVAMCVNDVLAQGAEPLFFLDYFATGKLEEGVAAQVIGGVAAGCREAGCALIGGETAEMPGMYAAGEYDLAGFCVGAVERKDLLPRAVAEGDILIGLASSGAHSNGYSLIRKIVADAGLKFSNAAPFDAKRTLGEALLAPTRIYVKSVLPLLRRDCVKGFAHITGGGLTDNVPRVFDEKVFAAAYDDAALALPPLFDWLKQTGGLSDTEMRRTFNCGIGGVVVVAASDANDILVQLKAAGENARIIGHIAKA
ncbi:MAG: phosphoribosylformylglycinamidine cyclo-ligase [Amphiplicatus sp.]|nr:phosphoribosylformylglycinamidine cyclo-ligase [Amphiplicatus sp.]MCB9954822.1 phosphoribosylformylglycinamidine cyclo-ligase [Caulobacterales bacterium]HRX37966.1 phosphoribosylformylglycinamidine cyclo-ligase [Parvularculaceae bacterium]